MTNLRIKIGTLELTHRQIFILLIVAIVTVIAIIVNSLATTVKSGNNELRAIESLKMITQAMESWQSSYMSYDGATLELLAETAPTYIDQDLSKGYKDGYMFELVVDGENTYICTAIPLSEGKTGKRIFRITQEGVIEAAKGLAWERLEE